VNTAINPRQHSGEIVDDETESRNDVVQKVGHYTGWPKSKPLPNDQKSY